jgi:hypothetical protein
MIQKQLSYEFNISAFLQGWKLYGYKLQKAFLTYEKVTFDEWLYY